MLARSSILLIALTAIATPAGAQDRLLGRDDSVFTTTLAVPAGGAFRLYNFNGPIETTLAAGSQIEVRAVKSSRSRDRIRAVAFEVVRDGNTVALCAVRVARSRCSATGMERDDDDREGRDHDHDWDDDWDDDRPPRVAFRVAVPKGIALTVVTGNGEMTIAGTGAGLRARSGNGDVTVAAAGDAVDVSSGNGDLEVSGAGGPVRARTGNGRVRVRTTTGPVNASTGNGAIDVEMERLARIEDMEFRTGNGRVTVTLPANYEGRIESSTGNGGIESDFAITVDGRLSPRSVRGTIGKGGPRLRLSTGNGSIYLRKGR